MRQLEPEYGRTNRANNFVYSEESCKERIEVIKEQVTCYEGYLKLQNRAKNMIMGSVSKDLWTQVVDKTNPTAIWLELQDYQTAGVPELGKELARFTEISRLSHLNP